MHKPSSKKFLLRATDVQKYSQKDHFAAQKPRIIENFSINCRPQARHIHISTTNRQRTQYCSETQAKFCVTSGSKNLGERTLKITVKFFRRKPHFSQTTAFLSNFKRSKALKTALNSDFFEILPPFRVSREDAAKPIVSRETYYLLLIFPRFL